VDLGVSGLASGFDWRRLVDQLADVERLPQNRLRVEQQGLRDRNAAYGSLVTELSALQAQAASLGSAALFLSRTVSVDDSTVARASAQPGALEGAFAFHFEQLATATKRLGQAGIGQLLSYTHDVSGLVLADAGFSTAVTAGVFSVNGRQIALATSDTLQEVFDKIAAATGGEVSASYDAVSDRITLAGSGEVVLGSATDTSNFLQVSRLNNNGSNQITSGGELGGVRLAGSLADARLNAVVSDGGAGEGRFRINGVEIGYSLADSVANVLARINESSAGVQASYDSLNDRFVLINQTTGDLGMGLEDVNGNFLAATGLTLGTLQRGQDLLYSLNGGSTLRSQSNTLTEASSGLAGLSVTALREGGTAVINVGADTERIQAALTGFVAQYNKVQSLIDTQTAISTAADGKVSTGVLARDSEVSGLAGRLRNLIFSPVTGLPGTLRHLEDLGYDTNSEDNRLALKDAEALANALASDPRGIQDLFTRQSQGLAVRFDAYLKTVVGEDGSLLARQDSLTRQTSALDQQVADLERIVQRNRARMIDSFIAMERAQAQTNQQLQFLLQRFGNPTG
jgi:flagellar hook-associated protein 2